jgi:molecular chaperone HscB
MAQSCWNCHIAVRDQHFCPSCNKILPIVNEVDYFTYLGMKRRLSVDLDELEKRFYDLSKQMHPDYHYTGSELEQEVSLEKSTLLNVAYRTLRDPIERAKYMIQLYWGEVPKEQKKVPQELLMEVMDLQEKLQEEKFESDIIRKESLRNELALMKSRLEAKMRALETNLQDIFAEWDTLADAGLRDVAETVQSQDDLLKEMNKVLSIRKYLGTLIGTIDAEVFGETDFQYRNG